MKEDSNQASSAGNRSYESPEGSSHPPWVHKYFSALCDMRWRYNRMLCKLLSLQDVDPKRAAQLAQVYIAEMNFVAQEPERTQSYWMGI